MTMAQAFAHRWASLLESSLSAVSRASPTKSFLRMASSQTVRHSGAPISNRSHPGCQRLLSDPLESGRQPSQKKAECSKTSENSSQYCSAVSLDRCSNLHSSVSLLTHMNNMKPIGRATGVTCPSTDHTVAKETERTGHSQMCKRVEVAKVL